ncbi:MAG: hypothetical protein H0V15_02330 [Solirubrobacterales bacterium]|nr:hypothetical protein [Solirubrobacterales bacterium]
MPIYEYRCESGHQFEVIQSMSADPVTSCEECGAPVERVFHPIAVHFKGSGFYNTDYKNNSKSGKDSKDESSSGDKSGDKKSGDKKSEKKEKSKKPEAKTTSSD